MATIGFCFVARQKRMTLEGDHFYVDLVFYNRLLRCFVLVAGAHGGRRRGRSRPSRPCKLTNASLPEVA